MFYKNWPYWLKGGIIGIILEPIYTLILSLFAGISFILYYSDMNGDFHSELLVVPIILFFIIGAILGFIYGIIRKFIKK